MSTISNPSAKILLEFANLQVASEAFLEDIASPAGTRTGPINLRDSIPILIEGNKHSTKFTPTMAEDFVDKWKVVDHISNTKTGFSGTLF